MDEIKLLTNDDFLRQAEEEIEADIPGTMARLSRGSAVVVIQEQAAAADYSEDALRFLGTLVKVAAHYGNVVMVVKTDNIVSIGYNWKAQNPSGGSSKGAS